jgi:hypothetical protein
MLYREIIAVCASIRIRVSSECDVLCVCVCD